jgi:uncharacterized NAD(P)/FAD-binding protein YdhS
MPPAPRTIVIVGGGFSGTMLATLLLQQPAVEATRIVLIERRARLGQGVAYAPHAYPYLLNVPAGRMSAMTDEPAQWLEFARRSRPEAAADSFLPRELYGEYLQHLLDTAESNAPPHLKLERIQGSVSEIHPLQPQGLMIVQATERRWLADQVVLTCGDPPPAIRGYAADVATHPAYVGNPYAREPIRSADGSVLLIGTGLTMLDMAIAAVARNPQVRLTALSRHGLLPLPQENGSPTVLQSEPDLRACLDTSSARRLMAGIRALAQRAQRQGGDWREVIMRLREIAPELWQKLNHTERSRFLRHARTYWDVHRHRMPATIAAQVALLRRTGQLQVHAGRVQQLRVEGSRISALWRPRGRSDSQELCVDRVVECSGADGRLSHTRDPLLRQLLDGGLASSDPSGLGLNTADFGALIDAEGRVASRLFYLGPMLRARHWEATAVQELRAHADRLAQYLAGLDVVRGAQRSAAPERVNRQASG